MCPVVTPPNSRWSAWEHARFLEALELYPSGPWSHVAWHIGSKTARQVMTHAQKYRQRLKRRQKREEALRRIQDPRLVPGAHFSAAAEPAVARGRLNVVAEANVVAPPAPVAVYSNDHQTTNGFVAVVPETATLNDPERNDPEVDDFLRWVSQFLEGFPPTPTEFDLLE